MFKKIFFSVLAFFTISLSVRFTLSCWQTIVILTRNYFSEESGQNFFEFVIPIIRLIGSSFLAVFWCIYGLINVFRDNLSRGYAHFLVIKEQIKAKSIGKSQKRKKSKIAKMKAKIEKMESDE